MHDLSSTSFALLPALLNLLVAIGVVGQLTPQDSGWGVLRASKLKRTCRHPADPIAFDALQCSALAAQAFPSHQHDVGYR